MANKNTRLVYTDENSLSIYRNLPDKDFKEFMMAYLTYQKGMDIESMFTSLLAKIAFMGVVSKIEHNEDKWEKQAQANRENGRKGGRPKKNVDITPNTDFENGTGKETVVQEEQAKEQEYSSRANQQDTFQESEEQNEFEVEEYIENNIEGILIAKYQRNGDKYNAELIKLQDEIIERFLYVDREEAYVLITDAVKRRSSKVS